MSENQWRNRYAKMFATVLAVENLAEQTRRTTRFSIRVEAEDEPHWDDVVCVRDDETRRYQVKRQQTELAGVEFEKLLGSIEPKPATSYHFVVPVLLNVEGADELRILKEFLRRLRQDGASKERVLEGLRTGEQRWLDFVRATLGNDDRVWAVLERLYVDVVGDEAVLEERGIRGLIPTYDAHARDAWSAAFGFVRDADGVVEITSDVLVGVLPRPEVSGARALYLSLVEEVERAFMLDKWPWLSDACVRNLLPWEFINSVSAIRHTAETTHWPADDKELEAAFHGLVDAATEYVSFFMTRSEDRGTHAAEDLSYKRVFPNPRYHEEVTAAEEWDKGLIERFKVMVEALNAWVRVVRERLDRSYRLRNGVFAVYDDLGVRSEGNASFYLPGDADRK